MIPPTRLRNVDIAVATVKAGLGPKNKNDATMRNGNGCDLCSMLETKPKELTSTCVREASGDMCANCKVWGLPSCSWTPELRSATAITMEARRVAKSQGTKGISEQALALRQKARAALYTLLVVDDEVTMFKANMFVLKAPSIDEDDEDDGKYEDVMSDDDTDDEDEE